jgi:hypothetical protein
MFMFTCLPDDCYQYYYNEMKAKNTTLSKQFQNVTKIKYIMYNVQDYSILYNNAVCLVISDGWHFTHLGKTLI